MFVIIEMIELSNPFFIPISMAEKIYGSSLCNLVIRENISLKYKI